jgi:hypothetical protein
MKQALGNWGGRGITAQGLNMGLRGDSFEGQGISCRGARELPADCNFVHGTCVRQRTDPVEPLRAHYRRWIFRSTDLGGIGKC